MGFAVALAGGGVKGAYEAGALKALSEMNIEIHAVSGTSIGSINGAAFVQGSISEMEEVWRDISIEKIIALSSELAKDNKQLFNIKNLIDFSKNLFQNKGIDVSPLKELLIKKIDEEKIRASKIDFGLTTFSLTDRTSIEIFKSDIPKGKMIDYLLASSCFPGFKTVEIDGKGFIDGGVTNNMPISMLLSKGYRDIIAINIGWPGPAKTIDVTGKNIITISNDEKLTGVFDFNRERIDKSIQIGYLDTYKAFGKLYGRKYYFEGGEYDLFRSRLSHSIIKGLEYSAEIFNIENAKIYKAGEFIDTIMEKYKFACTLYEDVKEKLFEANIAELLKGWKKEEIFKNGVIVPFLIEVSKGRGNLTNAMLKKIIGKEFAAVGSIIYMEEAQNEWQN